jgi:CDP-glucose 4,6-dehydratase
VIGGGDWARDRLMPDLMKAFSERRPAAIRNPLATRPWQHVLEPLRGYLSLAEQLCLGNSAAAAGWNFGPLKADVKSVAWIADAAARRWGGGAGWESDGSVHPREARSLELDISKAQDELRWQPVLTVDDAVDWTVRWHKGLRDGQSARALTLRDISEYAERVAAAAVQAG